MKKQITQYVFLVIFALTITYLLISRVFPTTRDDLPRKLAEANLASIYKNSNPTTRSSTDSITEFNFLERYPQLLACKHNYNTWQRVDPSSSSTHNYSSPSPRELHKLRITRAIVVYFPIDARTNFEYELRGLYRSWVEMQKHEPAMWRTDLIVFIERNQSVFNDSEFFLNRLSCRFENVRRSPEDSPMCTLIDYLALEKRVLASEKLDFNNLDNLYSFLLKNVDIFNSERTNQIGTFLYFLQNQLSNYRYLNSILIAFEG